MVLIEVALNCSFSCILYRGFMGSIPREIDEAAVIDGCGSWGVYFRIIMPLLRPVTATVIVLSTINIFNDFRQPDVLSARHAQHHRAADALQLQRPSIRATTTSSLPTSCLLRFPHCCCSSSSTSKSSPAWWPEPSKDDRAGALQALFQLSKGRPAPHARMGRLVGPGRSTHGRSKGLSSRRSHL